MGRIEEEDEDEAFSEVCSEEMIDDGKGKRKIRAQRFDFRLNNQYQILNIKIDEAG
mgnify:CR=1 FL=1